VRLGRGLCAGLAFLLAAGAHAEPPNPLLWKVSDGDNSVYLLGTFHLLKQEDYPLDARVYAALDDAEKVLFEIAPEVLADPRLGRRFAQAGLRTDGRRLQDTLDAKTWAGLKALAVEAAVPEAALQQMKPWFAALTLSMSKMTGLGLDPALGLDKHLGNRAALLGKPSGGLETVEQQIALFDGLAPNVQIEQVRDLVERGYEIQAETAWLHDQWRDGDEDALYWGMAAAMKARDAKLYARINTDRNASWMPRLRELLEAPSADDALVAVGALHLLGAEGLVQRLAAEGYSVERL
jgi:uncharacterized protein YbaP (TraB family)